MTVKEGTWEITEKRFGQTASSAGSPSGQPFTSQSSWRDLRSGGGVCESWTKTGWDDAFQNVTRSYLLVVR